MGVVSEPTDEADRGRHPGFARHEVLAGGPGSLAVAFGGLTKRGPLLLEKTITSILMFAVR